MPRRTLLSSEQRTWLFSVSVDASEMNRHYSASAHGGREPAASI